MSDQPEEIKSVLIGKRYRKGDNLGNGRYAIAYDAEDTLDNHKRVVIKLIRIERDGFDKRKYVFNKEISILNKLQEFATNSNDVDLQSYYKNVIKYITSGTHKERLISNELIYLVFEPLSRESISIQEIIGEEPEEKGKLGITLADEVIDVLIGCCEALILAHSCKIAYCDFKPEHVFWDGNQVTLVDWNMASKDTSFEGVVTEDRVRLRAGAGTYYSIVHSEAFFNKGAKMDVLDGPAREANSIAYTPGETNAICASGLWYNVQPAGSDLKGWMCANYLDVEDEVAVPNH